MRKAALALGAVLALVPSVGSAAGTLEIVAVDMDSHPEVSVTVEVPAELAGVDLPAEAFTLVENGFAVAAGVWTSEQEPLDVILVMDTSGSMAGEPMADAIAAASGFVDRLPSRVRVGLVSSGDPAEIRRPLDAYSGSVQADLSGLTSGGETALYDAVLAAIGMLDGDAPRTVVVILSDGGDTVSTASLGDAVDALLQSGAETSVIGLETGETDTAALASVAAAGGGEMISVDEAAALGDAFGSIADDLSRRYRLVYRSTRHGSVRLVIGLAFDGIEAVAETTVELPGPAGAAPATTLGTSPPAPGVAARATASVEVLEPSMLAQPWAMPTGVAAAVLGAAALMALVMSSGRRPSGPILRRPVGARRGVIKRLTNRAEAVTDHVLQSRGPGRLERDLDRAGIALRPSEFVLLSVSAGIVATAGSLLVVGPPIALAIAFLALGLPRMSLRVLTARRRAAFADQFDGTLQMLSGSLRAGYGLMQAAATVADEAPSPTGDEFARVAVENQLGRTVESALRSMAGRMDNEDLAWVVEAIDIQYEVGGDLAEVLDTVAETIRDRDQIRRQVKALSAEGRISAVILISMPFVIAVLIGMMSPDYLADLTGTTIGRVMMGGALFMIGIGAAWIKHIVKVVF